MEFYKEELEKYIYSKIDNNYYNGNKIFSIFSHTILKPKLIQLRKIEYSTDFVENEILLEDILSKEEVEKNLKIINFLYHLLLLTNKKRSFIDPFIHKYDYMKELYDRNSFFYRCMNKYGLLDINKIRVISVIEHNKCIEYVYKHYRDSLPTIVTFDSHQDLIGIHCKKGLNNYFNHCNHETFELNKMLYESVPFIGSVLYPITFPYEKNNGIITISPEWSNFEFINNYLYIDKNIENFNNCFFSDQTIKLPGINQINATNSFEKIDYTMCSLTTFNNIDKTKISDNFILNIDLDYFCTNGEDPHDIDSISEGTDYSSYNRTIFDYNHLKNQKYVNEVGNNLCKEFQDIRKRINDFIGICLELKKNGKVPSMIILSDSTENNFTDITNIHDYDTCCKTTNNFTPKYLILWIKTTVYNHLKAIYNE